jgi:cysteinyl-tRNA synthetase
MHNAFLNLKGAKLAKRSGEQITLSTIVEHGYSPLVFRLFVFASHYRSPIEFSWEALTAAQENIASLQHLLRRLHGVAGSDPVAGEPDQAATAAFQQALADDLNTPAALATVMTYMRELNTVLAAANDGLSVTQAHTALATLHRFDAVLGIITPLSVEVQREVVPEAVRQLAEQRQQARAANDFARADALRQEIEGHGFMIEDTPSGPRIVKA